MPPQSRTFLIYIIICVCVNSVWVNVSFTSANQPKNTYFQPRVVLPRLSRRQAPPADSERLNPLQAEKNPLILKCPEYVNLVEKQVFTIVCQINAVTPTEVAWFLNDKKQRAAGDAPQSIRNGTATLTLNKAKIDQAGTYKFMVRIPENGIQKDYMAEIQAQTRPWFNYQKLFPRSYEVNEGASITLQCILAYGELGVNFQWSIGQERGHQAPLTRGHDRIFIETSDANTKLAIHDLKYSDRKYFTCTAFNRAGNRSMTTLLRVKNPTRWIWPMIAIGASMAFIALYVSAFELYEKRCKRKTVSFDSSWSDKNEKRANELVHPLYPKMMEQAEKHGYPTSVVLAVVKWKAAVEARRAGKGKPKILPINSKIKNVILKP